MTLRQLRDRVAAQASNPGSGPILEAIDRLARGGMDADDEEWERIGFNVVCPPGLKDQLQEVLQRAGGGRFGSRELFRMPLPRAMAEEAAEVLSQRSTRADLFAMLDQLRKNPPPQSCKARFLISQDGRPIATALLHPNAILEAALYFEEGEYDLGFWCTCKEGPPRPRPWGRLSNYGGGIAVVRSTEGHVFRSDPID